MQDVARIPRPRTGGTGRSERRPRESPHDKANSVDTSKLGPSGSQDRRGASANKSKSGKRTGARNTSAKRASVRTDEIPQGSSASGLGFEGEANSSTRPSRSNRRSARGKRSDEAPIDVVGLDNQGSSEPIKRTLMRGKTRNSPMSNDNDTIGAEDMVTLNGSPDARGRGRTTEAATPKAHSEGADDEANLAQDDSSLPQTKDEKDGKGGSCRCVIS